MTVKLLDVSITYEERRIFLLGFLEVRVESHTTIHPLSTDTNGGMELRYKLRLRMRTNKYSSLESGQVRLHLNIRDISKLKNDVDDVSFAEKKFPLTFLAKEPEW